ncbi:MAG: ribonuclease P protein component [Planctomycetota bacterium]|nr:ribonuclease P protein component [Planctomycetota bacterium]
MQRAALPHEARLRLRADFGRLSRLGRVHPGREALVRILPNPCGQARLGVAAPRAYGGAVRRNRFKRLVREVFRHVRAELGGVDVLVAPRRGLTEPTLAGLRADLLAAPTRAHEPRNRP